MQEQTPNPIFWFNEEIQNKILSYLSNYYGLTRNSIYDILVFEFGHASNDLRHYFQEGAKWLYTPSNSNGLNPIANPDNLQKAKQHNLREVTQNDEFYYFIINMRYLFDSGFITGFNADLEGIMTIEWEAFSAQTISITPQGINKLLSIVAN